MDRPDADRKILSDDLGNLRTINRYFGGLSALRKAVIPLALKKKPEDSLSILDLATGSGDQPRSLYDELHRLGRRVHITAVDKNEIMLEEARKLSAGKRDIVFKQGDVLNLQIGERSFDIVTCSLALHHFSRENGIKLLREMDRICRIGFVVNDLARSVVGVAAAWIYSRLSTRNPMTRYDSVISVRRAFTQNELISMSHEAGVIPVRIYTAPLFRLIAVKEK